MQSKRRGYFVVLKNKLSCAKGQNADKFLHEASSTSSLRIRRFPALSPSGGSQAPLFSFPLALLFKPPSCFFGLGTFSPGQPILISIIHSCVLRYSREVIVSTCPAKSTVWLRARVSRWARRRTLERVERCWSCSGLCRSSAHHGPRHRPFVVVPARRVPRE